MLSSRIMDKDSIYSEVVSEIEPCVVVSCRNILIAYQQQMKEPTGFQGYSSDAIVLLKLGERPAVSVGYAALIESDDEYRLDHKSRAILLDDSVSPEEFINCCLVEFRRLLTRNSVDKWLKAEVKSRLKLKI